MAPCARSRRPAHAIGHPRSDARPRVVRNLTAAYELIARAGLTPPPPPFGISRTMVGNRGGGARGGGPCHAVRHLLASEGPRRRTAALRWSLRCRGILRRCFVGTVRSMLPEHDVYITDWHTCATSHARTAAVRLRRILEHLITFLEVMAKAPMSSRCASPALRPLSRAAVMAEDANPAQPRSLTLMAGPIDTRSTDAGHELAIPSRSNGSSRT